MADGGVSIAVRSIFPFKQARLLSFKVRREAEKGGRERRVPATKIRRHEQRLDHR
jgi:hypothetical protein